MPRLRRLILPLVGTLMVVVSLVLAQALLVVKPLHEPTMQLALLPGEDPALKPAVLFFTDLTLPESKPFYAPRIDVTVQAAPRIIGGCEPTTVEVNVEASDLVPRATKGTYTKADVPDVVNFALVVFGPTSAENLKELAALYSQLPVTFDKQSKLYPITLASGEEWMATMFTGQIRNMATYVGGLRVSFQTDWSAPRSAGSCYVLLPRLEGFEVGRIFEIVGIQQRQEWGRPAAEYSRGHREAYQGSVKATAAAGPMISRASGDSSLSRRTRRR